jgi:hypothetical protein
MFLTPSEIATLTGIKTGRNGETREQLQIKQLRKMGITFVINARSAPVITWEAINGNRYSQAESTGWTPKVLSLKKVA